MEAKIQQLAKLLVKREDSFLARTINDRSDQLHDLFSGKRILISGAAGFIAYIRNHSGI